jgi:hypothetical protein
LCLRAWKDICTSKKEGGLGIRNFPSYESRTHSNGSLETCGSARQLSSSCFKIEILPRYLHLVPKFKYPKSSF